MEKSIKRVERLVHATNSALAQMRLSLMFDDLNSENADNFRNTEDFHTTFGEKLLDADDLKQCQKEFNSEANEMLAKIERIFGSNELSRRNSKAVERIREINRKMKTAGLEQSDSGETQQSRQKLLSLIGEEKYSPGLTSSKGSVGSKRSAPLASEKRPTEKLCRTPKKAEALPLTAKTPVKSKEELKSKILETQEIVDRGFQTARQLAHKVDSITKCERKEKTPSTEKTASEINLKSLEGKSESNENVATNKSRKHSEKEKTRTKDDEEDEHKVNAQVIDVKRKELPRSRRSNLRVQRLPSVHIRGELQLQKIHNFEISTAADTGLEKSNTAIAFVSHERIEQEKMNDVVKKMRKENCCCTEGNNGGKYVECYHCGKLIRVCHGRVDPQKVDEILQMCNFNVFDPRIDEFVENYGSVDTSRWCEQTRVPDSAKVIAQEIPQPRMKPEPNGEVKTKMKQTKRDRRFTLQDLSDQLYRKYRKEADTLEGSHLRLDNILKNLFRKLDESRQVFENCHFLKSQKFDSGRPSNLTATKPVLVSFDGNSTGITRKRKKSRTAEVKNLSRTESPEVKMKGCYETSQFTKTFEGDRPVAGTSLISNNRSDSIETETKKMQKKLIPPSTHPRVTTRGRESKGQEENERPASATPTCTSKDRSPDKLKQISRKKTTEKHVAAFPRIIKPLNWIIGQGDAEVGSLETSAPDKRKTSETSEKSKAEAVEIVSDTPSASPDPGAAVGRASPERDNVEESGNTVPSATTSTNLKIISSSKNDETERKTLLASSKEGTNARRDGKLLSEATSERSENNYESDFESMTNEPEEHADEREDEEEATEMFPLVNKLSTISEVDSEIEKKLGEEPKASKSRFSEASAREVLKREPDPIVSEVSSRDKREASKAAEMSLKSTPTELVTSLKDILSALQDQFARTESLAEKLTENQKPEKKEIPDRSSSFAAIPTDANLVENLKSARKGTPKEFAAREKSATDGGRTAVDSPSEEGGSSLGEIVASDRRRRNSGNSESGSISENSFLKLASAMNSPRRETRRAFGFKLGVNSEDVSYSEGEIPSENLMDRMSVHSVGEVSH